MRYKDLLRDLQLEIAAAVNLHEGQSVEDNIFQIVNNKIEGLEDKELLMLVVDEVRCAIIGMLGEDLMDYFDAV